MKRGSIDNSFRYLDCDGKEKEGGGYRCNGLQGTF